MSIIVTGIIDLDPAHREAAVEAANVLMAATRAEDGCEHYVFSGDFVDPGRIYVVEQWASQEAIDAHMATSHLAEFMTAMGGFGVTAASLTKWDGATPSKLM
jgi:quinol monooxygenase YgiN